MCVTPAHLTACPLTFHAEAAHDALLCRLLALHVYCTYGDYLSLSSTFHSFAIKISLRPRSRVVVYAQWQRILAGRRVTCIVPLIGQTYHARRMHVRLVPARRGRSRSDSEGRSGRHSLTTPAFGCGSKCVRCVDAVLSARPPSVGFGCC